MPQATPLHTRSPAVVALHFAAGDPPPPPCFRSFATYQDTVLHDACRSAMATHETMTAISLSVADVPGGDPIHVAADAAIARLHPLWLKQVEQAWTVPAAGPQGLRDKAELLSTLIGRDDGGVVPGSPALALASSLAADVLQHATA